MLRMILVLGLLLAGCMGGEDVSGGGTRDTLRPGLYDERVNVQMNGVFLDLASQHHYNGNGTYTASAFLGNTEFAQFKGKWSHAGNQIFYTEKLERVINEAGSWGPWEPMPDGFELVRNITETSFQYYWDMEKQLTAEQRAAIQGLQSGWRTFNRIGD
jgi:hypothetical protein